MPPIIKNNPKNDPFVLLNSFKMINPVRLEFKNKTINAPREINAILRYSINLFFNIRNEMKYSFLMFLWLIFLEGAGALMTKQSLDEIVEGDIEVVELCKMRTFLWLRNYCGICCL